MTKITIPDTIDTSDESLVRWHFTNIAQHSYGWSRREAELFFRDSYDWIMKKLRPHTTRKAQVDAMHLMIESAEEN